MTAGTSGTVNFSVSMALTGAIASVILLAIILNIGMLLYLFVVIFSLWGAKKPYRHIKSDQATAASRFEEGYFQTKVS